MEHGYGIQNYIAGGSRLSPTNNIYCGVSCFVAYPLILLCPYRFGNNLNITMRWKIHPFGEIHTPVRGHLLLEWEEAPAKSGIIEKLFCEGHKPLLWLWKWLLLLMLALGWNPRR